MAEMLMILWKALNSRECQHALVGALIGVSISACQSTAGKQCDLVDGPLVEVPAMIEGKCDNAPRTLVEFADLLPPCAANASLTPAAMVADATHLYFVFVWDPVAPGEEAHLEAWRGYLMRVALVGGRVERVAPLPSGSPRTQQSLALTGDYAVYIQSPAIEKSKSATIARVPLSGGSVAVLAEAAGDAAAVIVDDKFVYFADESGAKRVPLDGGEVQSLVSGVIPNALGISEGTLYLTTADKIYAVAPDGGDLSTISNAGGMLLGPCENGLCGISGPPINQSLFRLDSSGTLMTVADELNEVHSLIFDGNSFFLTEGMSGLTRVSSDGSAKGGYEAPGITLAANDDCLFWSGATAISGISRLVADTL